MADTIEAAQVTFTVTVQQSTTPMMFAAAVSQLAESFDYISSSDVNAALHFVAATFNAKITHDEISAERNGSLMRSLRS